VAKFRCFGTILTKKKAAFMNTLKADFTQEFTLSFYRLAQNLVFQFVTHIYIYIYIYIRTVILPVVNWSLILRMEYRPRIFDNRMMEKMLWS